MRKPKSPEGIHPKALLRLKKNILKGRLYYSGFVGADYRIESITSSGEKDERPKPGKPMLALDTMGNVHRYVEKPQGRVTHLKHIMTPEQHSEFLRAYFPKESL